MLSMPYMPAQQAQLGQREEAPSPAAAARRRRPSCPARGSASISQARAARQPAIDVHPLAVAGDVGLGDERGDADVDVRFGRRRLGLVLELPRRLFQQLAVHLVADGRDVAGLLGAEDVAGAADFQVAHGDLEAGAEVAVFLDRLQSLGRDRRHRAIGRQEQVAVRAMLPPPDAAAKLVQLAQAESVGVVDDDRVGVGDIQAAIR